MRPQDIERIASSVTAAFTAKAGTISAGCGAFSSPEQYTCPSTDFDCSSNYQCGGVAGFTCSQDFNCAVGFFCSCDYTPPSP